MGRTVYSNKGHEAWDNNVAGIEFLGIVHKCLGFRYSEIYPDVGLSFPCSMEPREARETGTNLAGTSDAILRDVFQKIPEETRDALWGGSADDFVEWMRDWQKFLLSSGGYHHESDCNEHCPNE